MQTKAAAKESSSTASAARSFFSHQAQREPVFFSPSIFSDSQASDVEPQAAHAVQPKCAACESNPRILPQLELGPVDDPLETEADVMADRVMRRKAIDSNSQESLPSPLQAKAKDTAAPPATDAVQRKCTACESETRILPQLEVGPVDDPLETEADVMADHVVRRQAIDSQGDEAQTSPLQAKANDTGSSESTSPEFNSSLVNSHGSGAPIEPHTRDKMEESFGADFSAVRVHTGSSSAGMNEEIGARAFTYGTDIHFNNGEFAPSTEGGTRLLAHELTHVVQQNSSVRRAPRRIQANRPQLGPLVFGPSTGMPKGNLIHNEGLLPSFHAPGLNPGLWIEPPIPGANRKEVGRGLKGEPDFYRDNAADGRPIGINERKLGGFSRMGVAVATPKPPATPGGTVEGMDHAPERIELGDVKPGQSGEEHIGRDQISHYSKGITNTAKAVNDYQAANQHSGRWDPTPVPMQKLDVPDKLARPNTGGVRFGPLAVWEWIGKWQRRSSTQLKGSCIVYKSSVGGVWAYEWMPVSVPENTGEDAQLKKVLDHLESDVKPRLHSEKKPTGKLKRSAASSSQSPPRAALRRLVRRKPKKHAKFNDKAWVDAYNPWRSDAEKALGNSKTRENVGVLEALTESRKRTGVDPGIPQAVKDRAKGAATVRHWIRYGKLYGWLRKTFDRVYVKLASFAQSVKEKVKKLSRSASSSGFGNWIKAAALALFKVAKKLGAWAVSMIVDKLLDSLQEGVTNVLKQLAEAATPESIKSKIEEVEELKNKYELMLQEAQESLEKRLFGDKLEFFSKLAYFMDIANTVSTIVSVVRWGIRIVACASPPLLGCLWNLAVAALEYAFSKIMETCWFSAKVHGWIKDSGIGEILNFPTEVAKVIAEKINKVVPLPDGIGPLFAEIQIHHNDFKIDCSGGGDDDGVSGGATGGPEPTEEQKALMALAKEVGDEKFEAFLEMAAKRAADYNVALDAERITKLGPLIKSLTIEQMKRLAAKQPTDGVPVPVEEFLKSIATLTQTETERKDARKIDYEKAKRSNPKFERDQIKWKPELFVQTGIASDSKEFANAIFDIQKMLGLKPDGLAGPFTTKTFYERNKVTKDAAYQNAVAETDRIEATAAERRRIMEILAAPYPTSAQLAKDLQSLDGNFSESGAIFKVDGRKIILMTTDGGARIGGYYKVFEITRDGLKAVLLIDVSKFYTLDPIKAGDKYWAQLTVGKPVQTGNEFNMAGMSFEYAVIPKDLPANSTFEATNLWKYTQVGP